MIIYLYGPDSYRRQAKLKEIIAAYQKKHSALTIDCFCLSVEASAEVDIARLKDFATAQSLFDTFKLGIIDGANAADPEELGGILSLALGSKTLNLTVNSNEALKEIKILKQKQVIGQKFDKLTAAASAAFVKKEAERRGMRIKPAEIGILAKKYESDSWGIVTELDKLSLMPAASNGGEPRSNLFEWEPLLEEQNFFELVGRLQKPGSPPARLAALEKLLNRHEPAMIFNFVASRANPALKTKLADYDVAVKSGKMDYEEALTELTTND